jgi:molecular chaperone GrpE (heat shock protein)
MDEFENVNEEVKENPNSDMEAGDDENNLNNEIMEIVLNTREQGQMFEQLIKNQIEVKDEMINKLHKELEYYKQESADRFIDQVMKAIIKVRKDMDKLIDSDKWTEMSVDDVKREYTYIFEDLTDLLEQQNVDSYRSEEGDDFDPAIHQAKVESTDNEQLDKKIKESLSDGYKKGDKILIPERVVVYQFKN